MILPFKGFERLSDHLRSGQWIMPLRDGSSFALASNPEGAAGLPLEYHLSQLSGASSRGCGKVEIAKAISKAAPAAVFSTTFLGPRSQAMEYSPRWPDFR
jgi:hypothetical protein